MQLKNIIERAISKRATDVHLIAGKKVCFRIERSLMELEESSVLKTTDLDEFVAQLLNSEQQEVLKKEQTLLLASNLFDLGRFRVHVSTQRGTYCVSLKIAANVKEIKTYKFHDTIDKLHTLKQGLILISGPAASGKSVTCAKIIDTINQNYCRSIATIENPIAYLFKHQQSIVKQKEVGLDVKNHEQGLQSAMLDDSDVIFIDDVTGTKVLGMAIQAAERGKLVIGCLPSEDAKSTLKYVLEAVQMHQTPLRRMELSQVLKAVISHKMIMAEEGCRTPLYEVVINTPVIKRLILEDKLNYLMKVIDSHREVGMMTFDHHLIELIEHGEIEKDKGLHYASKETQVIQMSNRVVS